MTSSKAIYLPSPHQQIPSHCGVRISIYERGAGGSNIQSHSISFLNCNWNDTHLKCIHVTYVAHKWSVLNISSMFSLKPHSLLFWGLNYSLWSLHIMVQNWNPGLDKWSDYWIWRTEKRPVEDSLLFLIVLYHLPFAMIVASKTLTGVYEISKGF